MALALCLSIADAARAADPSADEAERAATIERVKRSVVAIKGVMTPAPAPAPVGGARSKKQRELDEFRRRLEKLPIQPRRQEGSGFVIDAARGLILTASQIVSNSEKLVVVLPDGSERPAERVALDPDRGIAILRSEGLGLPELRFAPRRPQAGDTTLVVGWMIPLRTILATQGMVMGEVSATALASTAAPPMAAYVALDNLLPNGGFGGSPVVDRSGEVIGLVSAIYGRDYGRDALTLMIATHEIRPQLDEIIARGWVEESAP